MKDFLKGSIVGIYKLKPNVLFGEIEAVSEFLKEGNFHRVFDALLLNLRLGHVVAGDVTECIIEVSRTKGKGW